MSVLSQILLAFTINLDNFVFAFSYGTSKIYFSFSSIYIISLTNFIFILLSSALGNFFHQFLSKSLIFYLSFSLIMGLGLYKYFSGLNRENNVFSQKNIKNYAKNHILSLKESFLSGIILAADTLGAGLSLGLQSYPYFLVFFTFVFSILLMSGGYFLGKILTKKLDLELDFLSGLILIILALIKLF